MRQNTPTLCECGNNELGRHIKINQPPLKNYKEWYYVDIFSVLENIIMIIMIIIMIIII